MKKYYFFLIILLFHQACIPDKQAEQETPTSEQAKIIFLQDIDSLYSKTENLKNVILSNISETKIQQAFFEARAAYKQVEFLAELYNPFTAKKLNQPALDEVEEEDPNVVVYPEGFQVIEELLFPYLPENKEEALKHVEITLVNIKHLKRVSEPNTLTDAHIFDAMRLEVFRLITLGISGFDSPIAKNSLPEAMAVLSTLKKYIALYEKPIRFANFKLVANESKQIEGYTKLWHKIDQAEKYILKFNDFDAFNRAYFITKFANPISELLLDYQIKLGIQSFEEHRFLKTTAKTLFEEDAFDETYFAPLYSRKYAHNQEVVALGKALFYDNILSGNNQRNCASCHQPERAFTDGLPKSASFDGKGFISRNAPTLLNAGLQASLFYEGRVAYMEDQITDVLSAKDEMHSSVKEAVSKLNQDKNYQRLFQKVFLTEEENTQSPITEEQFKIALATYLRSLKSLNSRFDKYMRGDKTQLNSQEINGFNLFMGKAKCGTCHFMPLFNGTVPPVFDKMETEIIGVPTKPDTAKATIDSDKGKFNTTKIPLHTFAFKTTTVRNVEMTAPYMHNGVYQTLEQVIDFYNRGGGEGIGIQLDNQTLPFDKLNLNKQEQKDLIAFMKSLTEVDFKKKVK
ncbi:cytochrome-c peroxidase [Thermoflexibacter ruber]|uniref:Cytochrome c peroxidase n=1 Tax=Thermoflexibacter ruber TaxID=1003 RepID=A0A1I2CRW2_9BACT|nr:cytochrome c peroxidase [Thermoflexibacter ruber]SFE71046.1 cytochrome c peroxidase [Thermoflexibacter ruber]